jgi:replicative DNA helicase
MVEEGKHGARLKERLIVWRGPLPFNPLAAPEGLANFSRSQGVGTLAIDSTKDLTPDLGDGATGAILNTAFQHVLAAGVELVVIHHPRKGQPGNPKPRALDDVYGATWLTAGMGSVVYLYGKPGDPLVEMLHLKQPQEEVGPWRLVHDHERGTVDLNEPAELGRLIAAAAGGLTVREAAAAVFSTEDPTPAQVEKARRKLERLAAEGIARRVDPAVPGGELRYVEREGA